MGFILFMIIAAVVLVFLIVGARRYPRIVLISLGVVFLIPMFVNCNGKNTNKPVNYTVTKEDIPPTQNEQNNSLNKSFKNMGMTVEFLESKIEYDAIERENLVLYFQFTNNSEENQSFCYNYVVSAFQNGVALDDSYFHTDSEASRNYEREIQPGTSVTVSYNYQIKDKTTPIQIEITPFSAWSDRKLLEFTVNPS